MVINIVNIINHVMNKFERDSNDDKTDLKWVNLICPSCAIYYGLQLLIQGIKKKRQKSGIIETNNTS